MRNRKQIVVIGLGRFGHSVARALAELGHEVLRIDRDEKAVSDAAEFVTQAVQADATDEDALKEMGVRNFDVGVVAIGEDVKSSILVTLLLKRLGTKQVISKAQDELHGEILEKVGAGRVVYPEHETGVRVAHSLASPDLVDYLAVTPGYGIAKLIAPASFHGKELGNLEMRKYGVTVLALQHGAEVILNPTRSEIVLPGSALVLAGRDDQLEGIRTS